MKFLSCGFVGLGLIGGSIARALKASNNNIRITVYDPNHESLSQAVNAGIADVICDRIDDHFADCDCIFLCAPVSVNCENVNRIKPFLKSGAILTDIGSVKTGIHEVVSSAGLDKQFIGGHPMTGTERTGFLNSKASLLENAYYIITRTLETTDETCTSFCDLVKSTGAIPLVIPFKEHDYITAAVSHVPHVISASLVNLIRENDTDKGLMKTIAAGGFKDITRISSSSPVMWQQICLTNSDNISKLLSAYIASLQNFQTALAENDASFLMDFFSSARKYRESFTDSSNGPIKKEYVLHIDIADRPGMLASAVSLLSEKNINIKNIGIVHNREYEHGTLRIEFHNEAEMLSSSLILKDKGYTL